jgi:hypothetical protein
MDKNVIVGLVLAVILVLFLIYLVYTKRVEVAKKIVLALVLEAEKTFGSQTGDIKYAYVIGIVYPKLPTIVKLFLKEKQLDNWIEDSVVRLKTELLPSSTKSI